MSQASEVLISIKGAVKQLNRPEVAAGCRDLIAILQKNPQGVNEKELLPVLKSLRRKRMFVELERTARATLEQMESPLIRTLLAQAFIDQGQLVAGREAAEKALAVAGPKSFAAEEARGLLGRVFKQAFVQPSPLFPQGREALRAAIDAYHQAYQAAAIDKVWPGVNLLALLKRAEREDCDPGVTMVPDELAKTLQTLIAQLWVEELADAEAKSRDPYDLYWLQASNIELSLALGDRDGAISHAKIYLASQAADAFEFASTARQLREIWGLDGDGEGKIAALPMLMQAEALRNSGGGFIGEPVRPPKNVDEAELQTVYGLERFRSYKWMNQGVDSANSVARIERGDEFGVGTGFLVRGRNLRSEWGERQLLLTNHHVIRDAPGGAVTPNQAVVRFTSHQNEDATEGIPVDKVEWYSEKLDVAVVSLKRQVKKDKVVTIDDNSSLEVGDPATRIYVVGHPGGRPLSYSMYDNEVVAYDSPYLYYRSPTEEGSSGSPLFTQQWSVVGIHHHGSNPEYKANGGTLLRVIRP